MLTDQLPWAWISYMYVYLNNMPDRDTGQRVTLNFLFEAHRCVERTDHISAERGAYCIRLHISLPLPKPTAASYTLY